MGCNLVVGANLFAQLSNEHIYRANKFAPTGCVVIGLNGEMVLHAVKLQKSFEELEV